ncbi:MAG: hypothetical protein ACUVX1_13295 [Chloroflexota bacterium]
MAIEFQKAIKVARFLDPTNGFAESKRVVEIRTDPLTGRRSRILLDTPHRPSKPDLAPLIERSLRCGCPFCPERIAAATPQFPPSIVPWPRITVGEATVVPNITPYDTHSGVCVMTGQHFVGISEFTESLLANALEAAQAYVRAVMDSDSSASYGTINWNYMPLSGGTLIHPHFQIIVGDTPSNYHGELIEGSRRYWESTASNYWADLITIEQQLGVRYIANTGTIHWLMSFAPRGLLEVVAVFANRTSSLHVESADWREFAFGLVRIARYLGDLNFHSFNMALFPGRSGDRWYWANARLVPRYLLTEAFGGSDFNYFGALHDETLARAIPEDSCRDLRPYFSR